MNSLLVSFSRRFLTAAVIVVLSVPTIGIASDAFNCGYETNLGPLNITIQGDTGLVTGTFAIQGGAGTVSGIADAGVITGKWDVMKSKESGYFYLSFGHQGVKFRGKWAYAADEGWRGDWTGKSTGCRPARENTTSRAALERLMGNPGRVDPKSVTKAAIAKELGGGGSAGEKPGKWSAVSYSVKTHAWGAGYNQKTRADAEKVALRYCREYGKETCKVVGVANNGHVSVVVSKKWNIYREGFDDKQRAFDACYEKGGPCYLLVRVGPDSIVERNKINFRKLKSSPASDIAPISPKYQHHFARTEEDIWNGLLRRAGSDMDQAAGDDVASALINLLLNPEQKAGTGSINLEMRFSSNSSAIRPEAKPILDKLASVMQKEPGLNIHVKGHCSSAPNLPLSLSRARSVKKYLVGRHRIAQKRITTQGMSNTQPFLKETSRESRLLNQRVEVAVRK